MGIIQSFFKLIPPNRWPGLVKETEEICEMLSIESVHNTNLKTSTYRKMVLKACHKMNEQRLRQKADGKEKCGRILGESYGKKSYISSSLIHEVRQMYKTRFGMHPFAGNFSHDRRFARTEWLCRCGNSKEEEGHILSGNCEVYGDIRQKFESNLNDSELVKFFSEVLARREKLEDDEKQAS